MKILIVGAGLSGLSAAVHLAEAGCDVMIAAPYTPERSQSVMAMGGIAAAINHQNDGDSVDQHIADTLTGGLHLADPNAVRNMAENAPQIIDSLEKMGTLFSRNAEGKIDQRAFGGHSKKRAVYCSTRTGKHIVSAMTQRLRSYYENGKIKLLNGHLFLQMVRDDEGRCIGSILRDPFRQVNRAVNCDAVVMATGGLGGVYGKTVGNAGNTGIATAVLFRQGVHLANLEFVQFHPTTVETPSKRMLISEAARGDGGRLFTYKDNKPWYFMEELYPDKGNLMPRDVISREIYKICHQMNLGINGSEQVYLDISHLDSDYIKTRLDEVYETCVKYLGLDPCVMPIPVYPGVHFFMGGIHVDINHRTNVDNLYAVGECACQYHGANRLGANSLLSAIYSGYVAARDITGRITAAKKQKFDCDALAAEVEKNLNTLFSKEGELCNSLKLKRQKIANETLSIARETTVMETGLQSIETLNELVVEKKLYAPSIYNCWVEKHSLLLTEAMLRSALARKESRGAHMVLDYPESSNDFRKTTLAKMNNDIQIQFCDIPEETR